jgi:hypothetical protein
MIINTPPFTGSPLYSPRAYSKPALRFIQPRGGLTATAAGWFVLLTVLWPAASRPYLAGSTDNGFMNLVLGYKRLARVFGHQQFDFETPTSGRARRLSATAAASMSRMD